MTTSLENENGAEELRAQDEDDYNEDQGNQERLRPYINRNVSTNGIARTLEEDLGDQDYMGESSELSSLAGKRTPQEGIALQAAIASEEATLPPEDNGPDPEVSESKRSRSPSSSARDDSQSVTDSLRSNLSPSPAQPFERRFLARRGSSRPGSSRNASPAFLTLHSRQASTSSQGTQSSQDLDEKEDDKPWEFIRWNKLRKLSSQALSETSKRAFGQPTCLIASASIVLGTSKGLILVFDYQQVLQQVLGQGTAATSCGAVTSLAISADHSAIGGGHANGSILTWDLKQPLKPFLHIPPLSKTVIADRKGDGHLDGNAVLHLGFLGMRRTALASADDSGMAFSHLATRGLGAVGRTVKTTRILGRYPGLDAVSSAPRKPSSVLAFSTLPLGNVEHDTDQFGLTALLTPYLLVIVSTTPVAQTQFKSPRAKNVAAHSAMTGCLCWFPSVKVRNSKESSKTKLAFCWSNSLSVVEVDPVFEEGQKEADKRPSLNFTVRTRWTCEEPILAVQWLTRSVLAVLTITQRLLILEDRTMNLAGYSDLNRRHLFHQDFFSKQLHALVDSSEQVDANLHGVVPDAYHMSVKAYKGRLFTLGFSEVAMGILSNWADRLSALMESGRYVEAIELATAYYSGDSERTTVGLPEDRTSREDIVRPKLLEMITASLKFVYKADENDEAEVDLPTSLSNFVHPIFNACLAMNAVDFLLSEVYDWYSNATCHFQDKFLYALEPLILEERITTLPADILKDMTNWYASCGFEERLEEILCSLDTTTFDIDQVTSLCKQYHLYDAFIHIWNSAINDFVTPLIELIRLAVADATTAQGEDSVKDQESAQKLFPYLAYTLTGRLYPSGEEMDFGRSVRAKSSVYAFLLSPEPIRWPLPDGPIISIPNSISRSQYPYLRCMAQFNSSDFMSMLNEAFEDGFLNDDEEQHINGGPQRDLNQLSSTLKITRGRIVNILWDVYSDDSFSAEDRIYLDMFLARNLAKYQGFVRLPEAKLKKILANLCNCAVPELSSDCELSAEYLLSVYHPPDIRTLIPQLKQAHFYRVLKAVYRAERQFPQCLEAYFLDDEDKEEVFDTIRSFLRPGNSLSTRQISDVKSVILRHSEDLALIDVRRLATLLQTIAQDLLEPVYQKLTEDSHERFQYLQTLIDPGVDPESEGRRLPSLFLTRHIEHYVQLMCKHDPRHVTGYINSLKSGDLRLEEVLPVMESSGVIDAAVVLMARDGLAERAMTRLLHHLKVLSAGLSGLLSRAEDEGSMNHLTDELQKYVRIGIWLAQGESKGRTAQETLSRTKRVKDVTEADLFPDEKLWLDLVSAVVEISRQVATITSQQGDDGQADSAQVPVYSAVRSIVQSVFTSLLTWATALSASVKTKGDEILQENRKRTQASSFIPILSAFLSRAADTTPSLADLRKVLEDLFSAYAFEESMLKLANGLIDKDVFETVQQGYTQRRRGWRPISATCSICDNKTWGAGAGVEIWESWRDACAAQVETAAIKGKPLDEQPEVPTRKGKGKGRVASNRPEPLISFACGHISHKTCIEKTLAPGGGEVELRCVICT